MKKDMNLLGGLIGMTRRNMKRQLSKNITDSSLSFSAEQGIMLAALNFLDNVNQQMLSECVGCDKTAITRSVDHLESLNLVKRVPDKNDRRQNFKELTKNGQTCSKEFIEVAKLTEKQALSGIDKEKAKVCKEVLKQIISNLETIE